MKNLLARLEEIAEHIEEHPKLELLQFIYEPPLTSADIKHNVESEFEIALPDDLKNIYTQVNGFKLEWELRNPPDDSTDFYGYIHFMDLYQSFEGAFGKAWEDILWDTAMDPEAMEEAKTWKPLDFFDPDDSGRILMVAQEGKIQPHLVLQSVDYGEHFLNVAPARYLEIALEAKGFYRWQYFLSPTPDLYNFDEKYQQIRTQLPKFFPGSDTSWMKNE